MRMPREDERTLSPIIIISKESIKVNRGGDDDDDENKVNLLCHDVLYQQWNVVQSSSSKWWFGWCPNDECSPPLLSLLLCFTDASPLYCCCFVSASSWACLGVVNEKERCWFKSKHKYDDDSSTTIVRWSSIQPQLIFCIDQSLLYLHVLYLWSKLCVSHTPSSFSFSWSSSIKIIFILRGLIPSLSSANTHTRTCQNTWLTTCCASPSHTNSSHTPTAAITGGSHSGLIGIDCGGIAVHWPSHHLLRERTSPALLLQVCRAVLQGECVLLTAAT